jgi:hypothetical protein
MLIQRLKLLPQTAWKSILGSPFNLFAVVLGELHRQVDEQLWTLNRSVGDFERVRQPGIPTGGVANARSMPSILP